MKILIQLLFLPAILASARIPLIPDMLPKTVEFTVVDPDGRPVEGALVEASRAGPGNATGLTDKRGRLSLQLNSGATLYAYVSKDGYYTTSGELWTGGIRKGRDGNLAARVLPDSFEIVLKPVVDPVPLRHKVFSGHAPRSGQPAGFDFRVGDWVAPHGKGVTTDVYFHFHDIQATQSDYTATLTVSFPNPGDGIQPFEAARPFSIEFGSNLAPPNRAPLDGYQPRFTTTQSLRNGSLDRTNSAPRRNYLFRSRSLQEPDGTFRQACYGWIQGDFEFDPREQPGTFLRFTYFFNPDPDPGARSLEYILHVPKRA